MTKVNFDSLPATKGDLKKLDGRFSKKFDMVFNQMSSLVKIVKDVRDEFRPYFGEHRRIKRKLVNHGKRINGLEKQVFPQA